ncbi:YqaJ viral recombinase family protein (plasmid) [Pseudomonas sp. BYT-5]|nr:MULTISPECIES: YqaJ viral recombinase family protein [unclassified Pseudomonas]URD45507.1 YqaJ viral recombinase family protein [Pseudomonas sp. BYT-5]
MRIITGPEAQQNSAAWFAWRSGGIGASEAPQIMGTSKFRSSYELFRLRLGIGPPPPANPFVDRIRARGHQLEPVARAAYERHTGSTVTPIIAESDSIPIIRASLDGFDPFQQIPVEIKCPGETAHGLALKGIVPPEYIDQVQHQIFVAEARFAHYYSFDGSNGVLLKVPRNQKRIDQILKAELDFWDRLQTENGALMNGRLQRPPGSKQTGSFRKPLLARRQPGVLCYRRCPQAANDIKVMVFLFCFPHVKGRSTGVPC